MKPVIVVGAGLGGLSCAVAAKQRGLDVLLLERAPAISNVGAGIQVPPNAGRAMRYLGLFDKLITKAVVLERLDLVRYESGEVLLARDGQKGIVENYGAPWMVAHREDYHRILYDEAERSGVQIRLGASVKTVGFDMTTVTLENGTVLEGSVIIGADGLWSTTRAQILGYASDPKETGDLAYRAIFSTEKLRALNDERINKLISQNVATVWLGPNKHCVLYPVRGGEEYNLVLLRPDNLPKGQTKVEGDLNEMKLTFEGWDPVLTELISCIPMVLRWKLFHHEELKTWTKDSVAILGDACHPTLPYQAQGAAMAVEDGVVIGHLLGLLGKDYASDPSGPPPEAFASILALYESLRKHRTTLNVSGARENRYMYHLPDGPEQKRRDLELQKVDWVSSTPWKYTDGPYQRELLGHDVIKEANAAYLEWKKVKLGNS
ncbi:putative salicylate hydroxylase [Cadophora sp. DSE1049]|nr:putative salicylate hydroxylase [Cadophora sp. DSE1049]